MRVTKLGRSGVSYEAEVFGPLLEEPLRPGLSSPQLEIESVSAVGGFTHSFVDKEKRRPVKGLPQPLLEGLGEVLGSDGPRGQAVNEGYLVLILSPLLMSMRALSQHYH